MSADFFLKLKEMIAFWPAWYFYALQDIKNKYTRSVLGPLWITISIGITILAMGPLYSVLFSASGSGYYLHLASGLVFWSYMSGCLADACMAFIGNESYIKQTKLPLFVFISRSVMRNTIILIHNLVVVLIIAIYQNQITSKIFLLIPNFILVTLILYFLSYVIAFVCARFRDVVPLIGNILQLFMFLTPIFWVATGETLRSKYVIFNPFNYLMMLLRNPFEQAVNYELYVMSLGFLFAALFFSYFAHLFYSKRVVYWL